jgi:hypothetical protein
MTQWKGERRILLCLGGPHDRRSILVHEPIPLEVTIDRRPYVLDEVGTAEHPGPIYVHVEDD